MLAHWGKGKTLVRIYNMENGIVYCIESPPDSGRYYLPLVEDGRNVEEYEILRHKQLNLFKRS